MQSTYYKLTEFLLIFILLPISFAIPYPIGIKAIITLIGLLYIIFVLFRIEKVKFEIVKHLNWKNFWKQTAFKFLIIAIVTTVFVFFTSRANLFIVPLTKPKLWIIILFVYSFLSVYPQELIYRTFYFKRYESLFKNENLFIFVNAIVFSLAHIFFKNTLVIILTFIGGILFAITFKQTKSTLLVSIEHALFGCWLFTVGMGNMLGFPS
ncbi:CPBP family intramembrane metalloprotease [Flavobacteriaceae bacterium AU392]|nr:CPBP family intramembrane metalloprotease [Flavobacteriaceae bacterium]RKM86554.1 CPBP family intramembrane metalloprotease [Flavobacteriaceae bacterium AU392]